MMQFTNRFDNRTQQYSAAVQSAETASCCAVSDMMNTMLIVLGTTLLVSIFVVSIIGIRLQSIIIGAISIIISIAIILALDESRLKEPPSLS